MEQLYFKATDDSPEVILNKDKGEFSISGNSFSEDPFTLYVRVHSWLKEYAGAPNYQTNFDFKLNYINTASSKQIAEILKILEDIKEKSEVTVNWHYQDGDEDTYMEGQELAHMFQLEFQFVAYESI